MTGRELASEPGPGREPGPASRGEAETRRRRRLAALGDAYPDITGDERSLGWSETESDDDRDSELRREVPPHHR